MMGSLGPKALKYESFEGMGRASVTCMCQDNNHQGHFDMRRRAAKNARRDLCEVLDGFLLGGFFV